MGLAEHHGGQEGRRLDAPDRRQHPLSRQHLVARVAPAGQQVRRRLCSHQRSGEARRSRHQQDAGEGEHPAARLQQDARAAALRHRRGDAAGDLHRRDAAPAGLQLERPGPAQHGRGRRHFHGRLDLLLDRRLGEPSCRRPGPGDAAARPRVEPPRGHHRASRRDRPGLRDDGDVPRRASQRGQHHRR